MGRQTQTQTQTNAPGRYEGARRADVVAGIAEGTARAIAHGTGVALAGLLATLCWLAIVGALALVAWAVLIWAARVVLG